MNYSSTVIIGVPASNIFRALTSDINAWWGDTDRQINKKGDVFKVSWGEPWYLFEVIEYQKDSLIEWKCIDANQIISGLEGVQKEWVGSVVHWNIERLSDQVSRLFIEHRGLTEALTCYEFCSSTWNRFLHIALKNYLESSIKSEE